AVPATWREFLARDFYTSDLYRLTIVQLVGVVSQVMEWVDNRLVDGAGQTVGVLTLLSGDRLRYTTAGQAQWYVLTVVLGTAGLVAWVWWR
ncbi:MAG: NAD(P)H-quinone oxidoreductase subunit F, partial [Pseudanabaenaceae cyanobacterium]